MKPLKLYMAQKQTIYSVSGGGVLDWRLDLLTTSNTRLVTSLHYSPIAKSPHITKSREHMLSLFSLLSPDVSQ
jgi:hypothetical protein